jgi:hypothetical protein
LKEHLLKGPDKLSGLLEKQTTNLLRNEVIKGHQAKIPDGLSTIFITTSFEFHQ